jgi:DNA-binding MurR/RpiR family transcriptional regulator
VPEIVIVLSTTDTSPHEILTTVKRLTAHRRVPVLLLTDSPYYHSEIPADTSLCDLVLYNPVEPATLLHEICSFLEGNRDIKLINRAVSTRLNLQTITSDILNQLRTIIAPVANEYVSTINFKTLDTVIRNIDHLASSEHSEELAEIVKNLKSAANCFDISTLNDIITIIRHTQSHTNGQDKGYDKTTSTDRR